MPERKTVTELAKELGISRQAWYQHRWKEKGICTQCGRRRSDEGHRMCPSCRKLHGKRSRDRYRRAVGISLSAPVARRLRISALISTQEEAVPTQKL